MDSVYSNTIIMSVLESDTLEIIDTICSGKLIQFNSQNIYLPGYYFDTFLNIRGCDSLIVLKLALRTNDTTKIYDTICQNGSYLFNSSIFCKNSGKYYDTFLGIKGCDSIIELRLSIRKNDSTAIYDTICQNKSYLFNNTMIANPGLYYDTLINRFGCDSFYPIEFITKK